MSGSAINLRSVEPEGRQPRLRVVLLGSTEARLGRQGAAAHTPIPGVVRAQVDANNWYRASRFSCEFAMNADPAFGMAWWAAQAAPMLLDVQFSLYEGSWVSMIIGEADQIDLHPATGHVRITGRDLASRFIDQKTQEAFPNRTASEIVQMLAARRGLTADVTATTRLAGVLWQNEHVVVAQGQFSRVTTEWDLMTWLAQREGFDLYVAGTVLHFHPAATASSNFFAVRWVPPLHDLDASYGGESNAIDLRMARALTLARDIEVVVRSWSSRQGRITQRRAGSRAAVGVRAGRAQARTQQYVFDIPNLTGAQAQQEANARLEQLSRSERLVNFSIPGDMRLNPRVMVRLEGTGTDFDQRYYVDTISSRLSVDGGFLMTVAAKNRDARSQVTLG